MFPCCRLAAAAHAPAAHCDGSSSYHRTIERPPVPMIVWFVQIVTSFANRGSAAAIACGSRVSFESSTAPVPGCGTDAGTAYALTLTLPSPSTTTELFASRWKFHTISWLNGDVKYGASAA